MKPLLRLALAGLTLFGVVLTNGCKGHSDSASEKAASSTATNAAVGTVTPSAAGSGPLVKLDPEAQKRAGLKTVRLTSLQYQPELTAYGRVVDPAPLAALVTEVSGAQASYAASNQEFERLKKLQQDQNASLRQLQAAEAAAQKDRITLDSAKQRLVLGWGRKIADQATSANWLQSVTRLESALVRVDLLAGESLPRPPENARLETLRGGDRPLEAVYLSPAPLVDPLTQGQGLFFTVRTNTTDLTPGAAIEAHIPIPGAAQTGVVVPRGAVLRYEGQTWVFVQASDNGFARRQVTLGQALDNGWLVSSGLAANDSVVVEGVQILLSEELSNSSAFRSQRD